MKALKRLNKALPGLIIGIFIYAGLVEVVGIWFVTDKLRYTSGLLIGTGCAVFMAIHIAMVIDDAILRPGRSDKIFIVKSVLRYLIVVAFFFVMVWFHLGNFIAAFIGVMGLKVSAYAQPYLNKLYQKFLRKSL